MDGQQSPPLRYDFRVVTKVIAIIHLVIFILSVPVAIFLIYVAVAPDVDHIDDLNGEILFNGKPVIIATAVCLTIQTVLEIFAAVKIIQATSVNVEPRNGARNATIGMCIWLIFAVGVFVADFILGIHWITALIPLIIRLICIFILVKYRRELIQAASAQAENGFAPPQFTVVVDNK